MLAKRFDGGKKIKDRNRHIVVDILGNLLHVKVHAANIHDTKASIAVFDATQKKHPSIKSYSADEGYRGAAIEYVDQDMKLKLHKLYVVTLPDGRGSVTVY